MPEPIWPRAAALAEALLKAVTDSAPTGELELPTARSHILGMFWRTRRLYEATLVLLKAEMPEEAAFIARSLFEESLKLRQMAAEPADRDRLILGWVNRSLDEKVGLLKVAKEMGLDNDIEAGLERLRAERESLQGYCRRHGIVGLASFRSTKDAAVRYGRRENYWMYEWAHDSVHGTEIAWMFARRKVSADTVLFHAKTNDERLRAAWIAFAANSITDATLAACEIFGWPARESLVSTDKAIEKLLETQEG